MLDIVCIFLLYAIQGTIQGVVFGTLPLLLRRNPAATDLHQSQFSIIGYPFSLKFLIAPLVDGVYIARVGKRESWLLPLQLLCAVLLGWLASRVGSMMESNPPEVGTLSMLLFALVAATAAGDIATDAWAAGRMTDSRASVCQAVGLTLGSEAGSTIFFLLMGKKLLDLEGLLRIMSTLGFAVLGCFVLGMVSDRRAGTHSGAAKQTGNDDEEEVGVREVLYRVWSLLRESASIRLWMGFNLLVPVLGGHASMLSVRYQAAGFSPELFAEYDLYLLPVSVLVMWLGGKISQTGYLLSALSWTVVLQGMLHVAMLVHFWRLQAIGNAGVSDLTMRTVYVVLNQLANALGTINFVIKVAFNNRIAQKRQAIAGTVITFMASITNLGSMLPGTLVPLLVDKVGLDISAAVCLSSGFLVLFIFWRPLRRMEADVDAA